MQTRCALWIVAVLILSTGAAIAAQAPAVPASAVDAAFVASLACDAPAAAAPQVGSVPRPQPASTLCGSCSLSPCAGAVYNTPCNAKNGHCISPLGMDCVTGTPKCQCWTGQIP